MSKTKLNGEKIEFDWGSCQYDTAAEIYHQLLDKQLDETKFVESKKIEPDLDALRKEFIDNAKAILDDDEEELKKELIRISKATTPEDFFNIARELAWDLWSAIFIADYFIDYDIREELELETFGPILNRLAQGENFRVAVLAYLLTKYYETDEEAFKHFDT